MSIQADIHVTLAIIGTGTAGMSAYRKARKQVDTIALIEGGAYGTTCARVGCMPSKLLIAPANACHTIRDAGGFGLNATLHPIDSSAVMQRVRAERDRFVSHVVDAVDAFDDSHKIRATASFLDNNHLALSDGRVLRAERIIIATGSRPRISEPLKAAKDRLLTTDSLFDLETLPDSIAVFGSGVIGIELGQALHRLGVQVHLFGKRGTIGFLSDPNVKDTAREILRSELPFTPYLTDVSCKRSDAGVITHYKTESGEERSLTTDYILAATGRSSNIDTLALENTSLELDEHGVPVFDSLSTACSLPHIFICGDANNNAPLLHEAADEGNIAGSNAASYPETLRQRRKTPLQIMFCEPNIAQVGCTYQELHEKGCPFVTGHASFDDQGRSRVMRINQGILHVYVEPESGRVLGAEMIGPRHEHLAHILAWCIQADVSIHAMLAMPFYHPTIEEGLRTALRNALHNMQMSSATPARCIDCGAGS